MKLSLPANISKLRKEHSMTQEQLAEALGVTFASVSKWERGVATPELNLIAEMADLFGVSFDAIVGFEVQNSSAEDAVKKVQTLIDEKNFEEAVAEAEKAMKKFPNNFGIVYQGAMAYLEWSHSFDMNGGMKDWQEKAHTRGEEVFKHALELLPQNNDPKISQVSLSRQFAEFHEFCMYIYRAIDVLKESNVCGINDARIGNLYVSYIHDPAKAEEYLTKAYTTVLRDMDCIILGFADICSSRDDKENAVACVEWLRKVLRGIQSADDLTDLDRYDVFLDRTCAFMCCQAGDYVSTKKYLKDMLEKAIRYDKASSEEIKHPKINTIMHIKEQPYYAKVWAGKSLKEWLQYIDCFTDDDLPGLKAIWNEVKEEVL